MRIITVSTCNLNQLALDFVGNFQRILEAVQKAKADGSSLIITPELSLSGYSCLDAFLEQDTEMHCWEVLQDLMTHDDCQGIIIDVGMPLRYKSVLYNTRMVFFSGKILYCRPKISLANDGLFREQRYFTPWVRSGLEKLFLPNAALRSLTGQREIPIGQVVLHANDMVLGNEMCEELFTPDCPSIHLALNGVEIICNSSASHWQLRKLDRRLELMQESSKKGGSLYLYSNQQGCDGEARQYFDGCCLILLNGEVLAQGSQFSLSEVEVISATVDLDQMWDARFQPARRMQAAKEKYYPSIEFDASFADDGLTTSQLTTAKPATILNPEEEIGMATGCWMWDYIRRASAAGVFLPLSGGVDSAATAVMVCSMTRLVYKAVRDGNEQVIKDMRRITGEPDSSTWLPSGPSQLCERIFHTCYMGTENSSRETRDRACKLAKDIGAYHIDLNMDAIVRAFQMLFTSLFGFQLGYKVAQENRALQNIQARSRMVLSYLLASTLTLVRGRPGGGTLLVLGSANVDECLRGYYTKYDCSAADINPIGSISKKDLARFLRYAKSEFKLPVLEQFLTAVPTAELEPVTETYTQNDEEDMGCTYEELGVFGRLRKIDKLGPYSMFQRLRLGEWSHMAPRAIFERVRFLWSCFGQNRHKQEILTPSLHAETYSPDSNRYDLLPFLRPRLTWQYNKIEETVQELEKRKKGS